MNKFLLGASALLLSASVQAADFKDVVSSKDGVVWRNTFENCVLTQWDSKTNQCRGGATLAERTIYFEFGSSALTTESRLKLDALARKLRGASNISSAKVVGYADEIGDTGANEALSARRAKAVENYLRSRLRVPFERREVRGLGESNSKTSCDTDQPRAELIECLAEDRRVEIELNYSRR